MRLLVGSFAAACVLLGAGAARRACAQTVVLIPQRGGEGVEEARKAAYATLSEALSLQGMKVIAFEDALGLLPAGEGCAGTDCAPRLLGVTRAELAAAVAVWTSAKGVAATVHVTLTDGAGHRYQGEGTVDGGDVRGATTAAVLDARAWHLLGPGPWLRVRGTPDGAQIVLDGALVGSVPYRGQLTPGTHQLEVRAQGYVSQHRELHVASADGRKEDLTIALEPAPIEGLSQSALPGSAEDSVARTEARHPVAGPAVLGVAGAALLTVVLVDVATSDTGCTRSDAKGVCLQRAQVNAKAALAWSGLGAAAVAGAVLWYVLGVEEVDVSSAGGALGLRGSF